MICLLSLFNNKAGFGALVRFYVVPYLVSSSSDSVTPLSDNGHDSLLIIVSRPLDRCMGSVKPDLCRAEKGL